MTTRTVLAWAIAATMIATLPAWAQSTKGDCSPVVREVGGNVSVNVNCPLTLTPRQLQQLVDEVKSGQALMLADFHNLDEQLGVTKVALRKFFTLLGEGNVPIEDLDAKLRRIAANHQDFRQKVKDLDAPDPASAGLKRDALAAIDAADYAQADTLLARLEALELAAAERAEGQARKRRVAAAAARAERGQAKILQFRYAEAAADFATALTLLPANQPAEALDYHRRAGTAWKDGGNIALALAAFAQGQPLITQGQLSDSTSEAGFLNDYGTLLYSTAQYPEALAALRRALAIDEKTFGPNHPDVAIDVNNIASVLHTQGDLDGAKAMYSRALAIGEKTFGPNHPQVAITVNNIGSVLQDQGDLDGAKAMYRRALAIGEKTFGPNHPQVAIYVNNIGLVLKAQGDLDGAKVLYSRALAIDEKTFGPNHPNVARDVNNIGTVLQAQGDLDGAKVLFSRALAIDEKTFGPNHPQVARGVNNIGLVLQAQGDLDGAKVLFSRALAIDEKTFGPNHPMVALRVNNIGMVLQAQGDLDGAKVMFSRALDIFTKTLGPDHPKTKIARGNLAALGGEGLRTER